MANAYYNYSGNFIPGTLARAEAVSAEFSSVATGFSKLSIQGIDTGTTNHYVFTTPGYPVAAYQDGNNVQFKALNSNTGPSDVNVNSIGVIPLLRFNGSPLIAGDISAGAWYTAIYEVAFGGFTIVSPAAYATFAGSISLAVPPNKVGLVAAAGVSTAAAPIDVTFAIDQAIAPTWTGAHKWTGHALQVGSPAGGDNGAGNVNVTGGFYVNNVLVASGAIVTSIAGTANQIAASSSTGAVTLSMPQNIVIPTPASGIALTVTGVSGGSVSALSVTSAPGTAPASVDIGRIISINNSGTAGGDPRLLDIGQVGANAFLRPVLSGAGPASAGLQIVTSSGGTTFAAAGNVTISAPSSGVGLTVTGVAGASAAQFLTTGVQIGSPTGGDKGSGTLNVASNLYVNNVAVSTAVGANPSVNVTLSVQNGSATTFMRSDAAPALSQSIAPTWTGLHTFTNASAITVAGDAGSTYGAQWKMRNDAAGATNINKSFRINPTGAYEIINSAFSAVLYSLTDAGNVSISAPSSGVALSVTGVAGSSAAQFLTTGVQVGSPTGGDKGSGTINVASNFYINGTALTSGVSSVTGTANQVTASPTTGAVVVGLAQNVIIPTPATGVALTLTGLSTSAGLQINGASGGSQGSLRIDDTSTAGPLVFLSTSSSAHSYLGSSKATPIAGNLADFGLVVTAGAVVIATEPVSTPITAVTILRTGGVIVGAATDQGAGTLSALTQLYVGTVPMYRTGTFTGTITGCTTSPTGTCTYTIDGNSVTLFIPSFTGTSNSTALTMTGLPTAIQPVAITSNCTIVLTDNSIAVAGLAQVAPGSGTITFFRDVLATGAFTASGFTAAGTKGMSSASFTYLLL
jgi:hypothetical protein